MDDLKVKCLWCGWKGTRDELYMDEHDEPAHCPICGIGPYGDWIVYEEEEVAEKA